MGIWFYRVFTKNPNFAPDPFIPPSDPKIETESLKTELARLRDEVKEKLSAVKLAQTLAEIEAQRRIVAEDLAKEAESKVQEVLNPHSAPPSVTIGNFGFLKTCEDNFDTKWSKF